MVEIEKSRFKGALIAAHPEYADAILEDEETEDDVAEGFDYDTFDEDADNTLTVDDYTTMEDLLSQVMGDKGYALEEYEDD